jgi:XTP/dITP diphosphohydrolase
MRIEKVFLATHNQGKIKEFQALLAPLNINVLSFHDLSPEQLLHVVEDGETFEENALKKAQAYFDALGIPALADDSGIEVDALDGAPGIYSARYAGEDCNDQQNNEKLISELKGVPLGERTARFVCVIAFITKEGSIVSKGVLEGVVLEETKGQHGFGYDPLFYIPALDLTTAELSPEHKNKISHRSKALQQLVQQLRESI